MFALGHASRHVSGYVCAMFCRYLALDERDVVGVCVEVCLGGSNMRPYMNSWHAMSGNIHMEAEAKSS